MFLIKNEEMTGREILTGKLQILYVSACSNFDTAFLPDCTKDCSLFSCYCIGNLIRIPKICLKQLFSYSKWVLQAILFLTVCSNCVSGS